MHSIGDHIPPNVIAFGTGYKARLEASTAASALKPQPKHALWRALKFVGEPAPPHGAGSMLCEVPLYLSI